MVPHPPALAAPGLEAIEAAAERLTGTVVRTPLVRLSGHDAPAEIWLKLENLQPVGSFKVRGAGNAMAELGAKQRAAGVYTASAGNMAQGLAWAARRHGVRCTAVVPDHAPRTKLAAIERLGARVEKIPFDAWWRVLETRMFDGLDGHFVHPVAEPTVIAGNGTVGLEILEDLPEVDAVVVPFGGGGLSTGIAAALRGSGSVARVFAAEVSTAAPLAAAIARGKPTPVEYTPSFVDGIGGKTVLPEMWPLVHDLIETSLVVSPEAIAGAIRLLVERHHVVAEGAGAAPVAAALEEDFAGGKVVCVVSGGNLDRDKLASILAG